MNATKIEWCDMSWNPITGCSCLSRGCDNCYAHKMAFRLKGRYGYSDEFPFDVTFHKERLEEPYHLKRPKRIFVCSMGDLFHIHVRREWVKAIWGVITDCPQHIFMILTKRPKKMAEFCKEISPIPNMMFGVTTEDQHTANERIPYLLSMKNVKRFISVEPMLSSVDIAEASGVTYWDDNSAGIHLVICGAETGQQKRLMDIDWARNLRDQCVSSRIPFFFKKDSQGKHELDGKTWEELPHEEIKDQRLLEMKRSCLKCGGLWKTTAYIRICPKCKQNTERGVSDRLIKSVINFEKELQDESKI